MKLFHVELQDKVNAEPFKAELYARNRQHALLTATELFGTNTTKRINCHEVDCW